MVEPRGSDEGGQRSGQSALAWQGSNAVRHRLLTLLGVALSAALLIGISWSVPLQDIWSALLRVDPLIFIASMLIMSSSLWVRGSRWAVLFRPAYRIKSSSATALAVIGLALNAVLPGRAGEVARVALASRRFGCGWAFATATVVGERLLDGLTLLLILGVSLLSLPSPEAVSPASLFGYSVDVGTLGGLARGLALFCLLIGVLILALLDERVRGLLLGLLRVFPRLRARVEHPLEEMGRGLGAFRSPLLILGALLQSLLIWLIVATAVLVLAAGVPGIELGFRQALGLTAISIAAAALPSAPGAWGVFEAASLLGLTLLSVSFEQSIAVAFVLMMHFSHYLPVLVLGGVSALLTRPSAAELGRSPALAGLRRRRAGE